MKNEMEKYTRETLPEWLNYYLKHFPELNQIWDYNYEAQTEQDFYDTRNQNSQYESYNMETYEDQYYHNHNEDNHSNTKNNNYNYKNKNNNNNTIYPFPPNNSNPDTDLTDDPFVAGDPELEREINQNFSEIIQQSQSRELENAEMDEYENMIIQE